MARIAKILAAVFMAGAMSYLIGCFNQREGVARQVPKAQPAEGEAVAPSLDTAQPVKGDGVPTPNGKARSPADRQDIGLIPKPSIAGQEGWTPDGFFTSPNELRICELISSDDNKGLATLLDSGVELNSPGKFGLTVLYWAYVEDDMESFEMLLKHGADPDRRLTGTFRWSHEGPVDSSKEPQLQHFTPFVEGNSIFFTSLWQLKPHYCFAALKYTKNINQVDRGENLLHRFLHFGVADKRGLRRLIDAGVDLNAKGRFNSTPSRLALLIDPNLCLQLLEAGADPSIEDDQGYDVADALERKLSHLQPRERTDVYEPLIKWFGDNYREIHWTKPPAADPGSDQGQDSATVN